MVAWQPVATDGDAKRAREYLLQGERRLGVGSPDHVDDHKVSASVESGGGPTFTPVHGYGRLVAVPPICSDGSAARIRVHLAQGAWSPGAGVHKRRPSPPWILDVRPDWSLTEPLACLAPLLARPSRARPCRPVRVRGFRTSREWPSTAVGWAGRPSRTRSRRVVEVGCWPGRGRLSAVPSLSAQHSPVCTVRVTGDTVLPRPEVGRGQG